MDRSIEFDTQVQQFVNGQLFRILAGLGATKAIETWVNAFIGAWFGVLTFWLGICIMSLFIAAKSPEIEA